MPHPEKPDRRSGEGFVGKCLQNTEWAELRSTVGCFMYENGVELGVEMRGVEQGKMGSASGKQTLALAAGEEWEGGRACGLACTLHVRL